VSRLAIVAMSLVVSWSCALADPIADFYRNNQVSIFVGYGPGGGYDLYARLVARHLGKHIPGEPAMVVQNLPGAGSLRAANYIYTTASNDGTAIATFARNMSVMGVLGGHASVRFDPRKFTWLGSTSSYQNEAYILWVRKDSPMKNLEDARRPGGPEIVIGGTADGSTDTDVAMLIKQTVGINLRVVRGYPGSAEINLAVERGEVGGRFIGTSAVASTLPGWLRPDGPVRPLLQFARTTRLPEFANVPTAREVARDERGRQLIELAEIPYMLLSRPFVAPPGVPAERAKALQRAFVEMAKDPDFLAEAEKLHADVSPVGATEAMQMIERLASAPADLKEAMRKLQGGG
jgi:tripartite-type tricarboxylate transporter receptor subunit TctC